MVLLSRGLHNMQVQGPNPDAPPLSYEVRVCLASDLSVVQWE